MDQIKNIIFDYDGTLHNSIKIYEPAFNKAYKYLVEKGYTEEKVFKDKDIKKWLGYNSIDMWNEFMPNLAREEKEKCSLIIGSAMIEYLNKGNAELYDGALEILNELKHRGYRLIFLSNCKVEYMNKHKKIFKLDNYFTDFYCAEQFDFIPKYKIFKLIKKKYEGDFIVVGDRFVDIEMATVNNVHSIGCSYGFGNNDELKNATVIAKDIKDIKELIITWDRLLNEKNMLKES
ncbi:HAD-IA family hydrolase [Clostridium sp. AL.422]|uniref:HAD family hydrolase n=1 Tax=Clostridium TaxID=1485 RepID=UPI00293DDF99|nr:MULTISPECIES: HAD-IA family hydrolase [unclassified Clostridium]MDV4149256.1 HAD-IA family hydrolase [Clostridium sp. AL.422]